MDLESVAEELYAGSPDDFVERRSQRVAEARAARERPLAKAISQLRRPTRSAWLVNLLSREAADDVRSLLDLGAALAQAQQRGAGEDLRRLSQQRHLALDALTRRATELAAAAGHAATEASRQEVTSTLQAALADPAVADLVRAGRVTAPVTYAGFGPLGLFAPPSPATGEAAEPGPATAAEPVVGRGPDAEPGPAGQPVEPDPGRRAAEEAVQQAADVLEAAEHEAAQAARDAEDATRHADEVAETVETLRERLQQAEDEGRHAGDLARAARRRATQHQRAVTDAQQALTEAQDALEQLTSAS